QPRPQRNQPPPSATDNPDFSGRHAPSQQSLPPPWTDKGARRAASICITRLIGQRSPLASRVGASDRRLATRSRMTPSARLLIMLVASATNGSRKHVEVVGRTWAFPSTHTLPVARQRGCDAIRVPGDTEYNPCMPSIVALELQLDTLPTPELPPSGN